MGGHSAVARFPWASALILVAGPPLLWSTGSIRDLGLDVLGPAFMPRLVLGILMMLALLDIGRALADRRRAAPEEQDGTAALPLSGTSLVVLGLLTLYIAALAGLRLNFELTTAAFIVISGIAVGARCARQIAILAVTAVAFAILVGWLFRTLLFVPLP